MKSNQSILFFLALLIAGISAVAQEKADHNRFAKITTSDFVVTSPAIDSGAEAIVLAETGNTDFEGDGAGFFTMIFKVHERILLKKRNSFDALAEVKIQLYNGYFEFGEKLLDIEASTYNLQNGVVIESKLPKTSLFKEKYNKEYTDYKFTLPDVKEGCIIDYSYTIKTPFKNSGIRAWSFQGNYPCLWSEYKVAIPPIFNYAIIKQGFLPFAVDTAYTKNVNYTMSSGVMRFSGQGTFACWAMKEIPAFKKEKFTSSSRNYISRIKFVLQSIRTDQTGFIPVLEDWGTASKSLLKDPDFAKPLSESNSWCENDLKKVVGDSRGMEKAKKIFEYVRDNYVCTDDDQHWLSATLKKTFTSKKGNVVDINMLLAAILIDQGFVAKPVLLSTRDNGKATEETALLSQYNYVVTRVKIDSAYYLLDASVSRIGFGKLPEKCYNGSGRLIDDPPTLISLSGDSLSEYKTSLLFISNDEKEGVAGSFTTNLGYYESLDIRDMLVKTKTEDFFKELAKEYPADIEVSDMAIDSLKNYDKPIIIKHSLKVKFDDDIVYFSPIINNEWKKNPFVSSTRQYPVEMSHKINETYILNMEIPKGYKVDELPKSSRIKLNDNEGMFEYLVASDGENIQLRCKLVLYKANFMPDDYQVLRDFFADVVKKEEEQFVFTKVK